MKKHRPDELLSVEEVAEAIGKSRATVFNLARDHGLDRYTMPARGKTTFLRWGDVQEALRVPKTKVSKGKRMYYFGLRLAEGRCPHCGSDNLVRTDNPDAMLEGRQCGDCGYVNESRPRPPFVLPGEPGSHDQVADYDR